MSASRLKLLRFLKAALEAELGALGWPWCRRASLALDRLDEALREVSYG